MYIYIDIDIDIDISLSLSLYIYIYIYICIYIHVYIYIYIHIHSIIYVIIRRAMVSQKAQPSQHLFKPMFFTNKSPQATPGLHNKISA